MTTVKRERQLMVAMMLTLLVVGIDTSLINIILPKLREIFATSMSEVTLLATVYVAILAALQLPFGRLADLFGSVRVFFTGNIFFFLGSLLCALSPSFLHLLLGRAIQGFGGAMLSASFGAVILQRFPKEKTGMVVGAAMTTMSVGSLIGPPLGGFLAQHASWHWAFAVNLPLCAVAAFLLAPSLAESKTLAWRGRLDLPGAFLSILLFITLPAGLHLLSDPATNRNQAYALLGAALLCLLLFLKRESLARYPLLDVAIFHQPSLRQLCLIKILLFIILNGVMLVFPFFLTSQPGVPLGKVGLMMLAAAVAMGVVTPLAGKLVDLRGSRLVMVLGSVGIAGSAALTLTLDAHPPLWLLAASLVGLGSSVALVLVGSSVAILRLAPAGQEGVFSALNSLTAPVGGAIGLSLFSLLYTVDAPYESFGRSLQVILVGALVIAVLAKAISGARPNVVASHIEPI